ncbi:MAG: hypothetical protein ACXQTI_03550 [Candidatus Nezhaarchaeales archaeon]
MRYDEVRKEAGGELRILISLLESEVGCIIYHNAGLILGSLEDYVIGMNSLITSYEELTYLHACLWDAVGDLKSSLWLIFTGHLRGAMMSLRSSLELSILGIYLSFKAKMYETKELDKYINYLLGIIEEDEDLKKKFVFTFWRMLCELESKGYISPDTKNRCYTLYSDLSKYVHTFKGGEPYRAMLERINSIARPSSASINVEELLNWYVHFAKVSAVIVLATSEYLLERNGIKLPRRSEDAASLFLKIIEKGPTIEPLPWVDCPFLREKESKN